MTDLRDLYNVRDYKTSDKNFVLATFLRGLYHGDSWFSQIPRDIFMENYSRIAEAMVNNTNTLIKIACLPDDEDVILGYSILSSNYNTIHWCYVKSAWRKQGIAKSLLPQYPTYITHLSSVGKSLMYKFPNAVFNPFL